MPRFKIPNDATIHTAHNFFSTNRPFEDDGPVGVLEFNPKWAYTDPMALSMLAAWGASCVRQGFEMSAENVGRHCDYAARMKLFDHAGIEYKQTFDEHETGR